MWRSARCGALRSVVVYITMVRGWNESTMGTMRDAVHEVRKADCLCRRGERVE